MILKIVCVIFSNGIIKIEDFDLDNILLYEKSYEKILVYNISNKNFIANLLRTRLDNLDGFITDYYGTR